MQPRCQCQYTGDLLHQSHRNHHRQWEQTLATTTPPTTSTTTQIEVTHLIIAIDSIIAALHGAPLPALTPGAAAIIANHRSNQ
jgi:predicted tellurium resistance membrane protein TerC